MKLDVPVSEVMTRDLVTVDVGQPVAEARRVLTEGGFHHVPVVSGPTLVGMLSSTDLLRVSDGCNAVPLQMESVAERVSGIRAVMSPDVVSLHPTATVRLAGELFASGRYHALPVVDEAGVLLGLLTTTDLIRRAFGPGPQGD